MIKSTFIIITFLIAVSEGLKSTSFLGAASVHNGLTKLREKRQTSDHETLQAVFCLQECTQHFEQKLENDIGLESKEVSNGLINRKLFEENNFQGFCKAYTDVTDCIAKCGSFKGIELILAAFKPLDYVCVERYQDFISHLPCYRKASKKLGDKCDSQCGGENFVDGKIAEIEQMQSTQDISGMLEVMGDLCDHLSCSLECEIPTYDSVCEDKEPGKLLASFVSVAMQQSQSILDQAGMTDLFPKSCANLASQQILVEIEQIEKNNETPKEEPEPEPEAKPKPGEKPQYKPKSKPEPEASAAEPTDAGVKMSFSVIVVLLPIVVPRFV